MSTIKALKVDDLKRSTAIQAGRNIQLPESPGDNEEYIVVLQEFMEQSAEQNKFLEAEKARQKIEELKKSLNKFKHSDLKNKHTMEQDDLEKAHQEELEQFNTFWDEKMKGFNDQADTMLKELQQRHNEEKELYTQELEEGLPRKSKDSNRLLDLKGQREVLSKQKQYIDAHLVHVEVEKMEQAEQELFDQERQQKIKAQVNHLLTKHNQEMAALQLKIQKGKQEQSVDRNQEHDRLMLKYKVVSKDVKNRQTNEDNYMNKTFNNPGMNQSRYMTQSRFNQSKTNMKK